MSQIRFNIGVPRAGSAARSSEGNSSEGDGWTRAKQVALSGSAARAAEERARAEAVEPKAAKTIALRASGGAVVDPETMMRHSAVRGRSTEAESSSPINAEAAADFPETERISTSRVVSADNVPRIAEREPEHVEPDATVQPGVLQSAAARIQSLTRFLFQGRRANVLTNSTEPDQGEK